MNKLNFFQERDFSNRINLVFSFIKQNFKVLITGGVYLLPAVLLIAFIMFYVNRGLVFSDGYAFVLTLLNGAVSLLYTIYMGVYAMEYTLSDNPKSITQNYIWSKVFNVFPSVFGGYMMLFVAIGLYMGLLIGLSLAFTIIDIHNAFYPVNPYEVMGLISLMVIPSIWVSIYIILFIQAYLYSNNGIINAIKESYRLVKGKWWLSFGFILGCFFIVALLQTFGSIPLLASVSLANLGIVNSTLLMYVATAIAVTVSFFTTPIVVVATHVLYTNLKEGTDGVKTDL